MLSKESSNGLIPYQIGFMTQAGLAGSETELFVKDGRTIDVIHVKRWIFTFGNGHVGFESSIKCTRTYCNSCLSLQSILVLTEMVY